MTAPQPDPQPEHAHVPFDDPAEGHPMRAVDVFPLEPKEIDGAARRIRPRH